MGDRLNIVADANMRGVESLFAAYGDVRRVEGRSLTGAMLAEADVLLVRSVTQVDRDLLKGSQVRFVGSATSGLEHVDEPYLSEAGIGFAHARGANANAVVEYVLAAIAASADTLERLLSGAVLGIVGQGHVGSRLRECARGLGITVRVCDPWLDPAPSCSASLEAVLSSDVVSLHPELTRAEPWPSYHLLNADTLGYLDRQALLINASRGAVIDNDALKARLKAGLGPNCVLDVWENEPQPDAELLDLVNLGSPHIAGYSEDARLEATRILARALAAHLDSPQAARELAPDTPGQAPFAAHDPAEDAPGQAPVLHLARYQEPAVQLRALLLSQYDIHRDDRALRAAVAGPRPAQDFDRLRREYPLRRELRGCQVEAPGLPSAWFECLGLIPATHEQG